MLSTCCPGPRAACAASTLLRTGSVFAAALCCVVESSDSLRRMAGEGHECRRRLVAGRCL